MVGVNPKRVPRKCLEKEKRVRVLSPPSFPAHLCWDADASPLVASSSSPTLLHAWRMTKGHSGDKPMVCLEQKGNFPTAHDVSQEFVVCDG